MASLGSAVARKDRVLHVITRIQIDDEIIHVVSEWDRGPRENNNHEYRVLRAQEGTVAADHAAGATVTYL